MKPKEELFAEAFKDTTYKIVGLPDFQMPIVRIRKEQMPQLDHNVGVFEYATRILVDRQKKIDEQLLKAINELMEKYKITDYYCIDETRLLEIIEEATAFEIIKKKGVNLHKLKICDSVEEYNKLCNSVLPLTQEEYDLLKRELL